MCKLNTFDYEPQSFDDQKRMKRSGNPKPSAHDADPSLIQGLRMGDHECYKAIFYRYHKSINDFLQALTKSEDTAQDITQEVFITLWEKREVLDPEKGIIRFLFRLAKQSFIHHYRHTEVRSSYAKSVSFSSDELGGAQGDEILEAEEIQLLIDITVNQMPKTRRSVFEMSRYDDLAIEEIASRLNISKDSVSSHLYNALRDIKNVMALFVILILMGQ